MRGTAQDRRRRLVELITSTDERADLEGISCRRTAGASGLYQQGLDIARELTGVDPANTDYRRDVSRLDRPFTPSPSSSPVTKYLSTVT